MSSISLKKITIDDSGNFFLLTDAVINAEHGFMVKVLEENGLEAYQGNVAVTDLQGMANKIRMSYDCYLENTLNALTKDNPDDDVSFIFNLKDFGENKLFEWKKIVLSKNIKIKLGKVILSRVDNSEAISFFLETVSKELAYLQANVKRLETLNTHLKTEKESALALAKNSVDEKEQMELQLYTKFSLVLNEKKEKIRKLIKKVDDYENTNDSTQRTVLSNEMNSKSDNTTQIIQGTNTSSNDNGQCNFEIHEDSTKNANDSQDFEFDDMTELNIPSCSRRRVQKSPEAQHKGKLQKLAETGENRKVNSRIKPKVESNSNENADVLLDEL